jgi:hypothetical protein
MPSMSYCRFEETLEGLRDCADHMNDRGLGPEEERAREQLLKLCYEVTKEFGPEK